MLLIPTLYWMLKGKKCKLSIMFGYSQIHPRFQPVLIKIDRMLPPVGHLQTKTSKIRLHIMNLQTAHSIASTLPTIYY